jgi:hypothetical protein
MALHTTDNDTHIPIEGYYYTTSDGPQTAISLEMVNNGVICPFSSSSSTRAAVSFHLWMVSASASKG